MFRYQQIRMALLTFALGLASVWFIYGSKNGLIEVPVNLPQTKSGEVMVVFLKFKSEMGCCISAGGGGHTDEESRSKATH